MRTAITASPPQTKNRNGLRHLLHHPSDILHGHIQHAGDIIRRHIHSTLLALHADKIFYVLFQVAEAVGESRFVLHPTPHLTTIDAISTVFGFKDDRRLQHLHRMPSALRHHTSKLTRQRVKADALHLAPTIIIDDLHQLATQHHHRFRTLRVAMDGYVSTRQQGTKQPLTIVSL